MYRFSINGENWILRFSPHIILEQKERQVIVSLLIQLGNDLSRFPHGSAFCIFTEKMGLLVFNVERIPSLIITISNMVPNENWYKQENDNTKSYY
ncbi:hypothetical protein ACFSO7_17615 [Bacillus sp. CGMCC 1.16607]|uniref:hypothetical protein n=1 Tax=Bacillus sp. CGMCC 1.16607 TaxID=3351842 RepID=UPI00363D9B55